MERRIINPWTWQDQMGFVQANEVVSAGRILFCSGVASVDDEGNPLHPGDMKAQVARTLDNLETILEGAGLGLSDVVRLNYYTTNVERLGEAFGDLAGRLAQAGCRPASTMLGVTRLAYPEMMVEIEATAVA